MILTKEIMNIPDKFIFWSFDSKSNVYNFLAEFNFFSDYPNDEKGVIIYYEWNAWDH